MALKMIDLFSGIGGIRIAFESNGVKCVASSEIDKYACKTYFDNFHDMPLGDVSKLTKEDFPPFDIIAGGFPCQPFSLGGLRKGFEDARGTLFFEVARLIDSCKPKAFLLENVQGLANHDKGNTLKTIENILLNLGYNFQWRVMNAKDYGVPQNRSRWYCVGFRNDLNIGFDGQEGDYKYYYKFPDKCPLEYTIEDILEPNVSDDYRISPTAEMNIQKYLGDKKVSKSLLANEVRASRCNFKDDGTSPCLTAKMGTGGNNVPILVSQGRKLTEKECLKIMGFPDWYKIEENSAHSYKQIGNSVVVPIITKIAAEMVKALKKK